MHEILRPIFRQKARAEWFEIMVAAEVPVAPIYQLDEALADPQVQHLGMIQTATHPEKGEVSLVGFPVTLSETPLGPITEHSEEILRELGYSIEDVARMRADKLI